MLGASALVAVSACSLLTSVDGLTGGDAPGSGGDASASEGGVDGALLDGAAPGDGAANVDGADPRFVAYGQAVLADTPLAYWRFEETTSLAAAKDERGLHDAVYGLSPSLGEPGIAGGHAVRLPAGQHSHVKQESAAFNFGATVPYAFEMWIKLAKLEGYQWLGGTEGQTDPRSGWSVWIDSMGGAGYEVWGPPLTAGGSTQRRGIYSPPSRVAAGTFHHVVTSFNGAVDEIWVDGVKQGGGTDSTVAPDTGPLMLGCRRTTGTPYQCVDDGVIDEVAIYDHALLDTRIVAHFQLGKP
jgi:hypothetical protein